MQPQHQLVDNAFTALIGTLNFEKSSIPKRCAAFLWRRVYMVNDHATRLGSKTFFTPISRNMRMAMEPSRRARVTKLPAAR